MAALAFLAAGAAAGYLRRPGIQRLGKLVYYRLTPPAVHAEGNWTVRLDVPYHRQEHALSCEVAALKMVLNYHGVAVTESDLIARLPFATREPRGRDNVWDDPDAGFVGDINGVSPTTGYGVYEGPLAALASAYRPAKALASASLAEVLAAVAQRHPVIVWGTLSTGRDTSWVTPEGKVVNAILGEHTRVVIGFSGTVEDPQAILLHDPIYGTLTMSRKRFEANWALLGNKAVVVEE